MTALMTSLSVVATATGAGMLVPQVLRLRRQSSIDGVSATWIGVGLTMNSWWLAYAIATRLWGLTPLAVMSIALYLDLARSLHRLSGSRSHIEMLRGGLLLGWVPIAFLSAAGWPGAGLAIGLCYGLQFVPAAIEAWRTDRLDGLSPTTWVLALVEALAWFAYGIPSRDPALLVGGGGGSIMAAVILLRFAPPFRPPATPGTPDADCEAYEPGRISKVRTARDAGVSDYGARLAGSDNRSPMV